MKVLFDLDGTLLDSEKYYVRYWVESCNELGFPLTYEQALELRSLEPTLAKERFFAWFGKEVDLDAFKKLRNEKMKDLLILPKDGTEYIVDYLKKKGIPYGICSASNAPRCHKFLKRAGIDHLFPVLVSAKECKRGKPYPDPYFYVLEKMGAKANECLCLEDSPNGFNSAVAAGIKTIFCVDLTEPTPDIVARAYGVIHHLKEAIPLFERFLLEEKG
ncbi:MAG: HAD family phosphatase [Bacilli bacterium]|nr:HAD family phosphatase [Bacilli bacterium]